MKGHIHSIESFGSVDGPGVRFVIFVQGCTMRCQFCHNPDSWQLNQGDEMSAEELLRQAVRFRPYWGDEGGITVSGGEALLQMDFLIELFTLAHRDNINTCLDTSAAPYRPDDDAWMSKFDALMKVTDTVLLDIKEIRDDAHRRLTGHGNKNILACARHLSDLNVPVWIRHVLVPGITDNDADLHELRRFIDSLNNVKRVEVLPYHTLGVYKYEKLGLPYPLQGVNAPTRERIENAESILVHAEAK